MYKVDGDDQPIFECQVIPDGTSGDAVFCDVTPVTDHQYEITFLPKSKGKHKLHIKADGRHILGSPFPLLVTLPVEQVDAPLQVINGVIGPFGIAVDIHGCLVVAEYGLHRVSIFDSGKRINTFGSYGSGDGEFINPRGVVVDGDGNILVSDEGNNRLQKFTSNGVFMCSAGNEGTAPLEFLTPSGISYNPNNQKFYVADMKNCRIQVLNSDLSFSHFIGSKGTDRGELAYPWDVAFDRSGYCYVADTSNNRIQVFTAKGYFLYSIDGKNQGKGEFKSPSGVAVDEDDILYIADLRGNKILAYTTEGDFKAAFGELGSEPGQFSLPHGLAIDASGVIYVSDLKNKRIQCF
jgi:tripartite motif-containing protein 2/3/tripartite motif-containing protein 71